MKDNLTTNKHLLPDFFKPLLWSYDFSVMDANKHQKTIIVNAINYGTLDHWRWLNKFYGQPVIKKILEQIPATEIRSRAWKLVSLMFSVKKPNYAPRGVK